MQKRNDILLKNQKSAEVSPVKGAAPEVGGKTDDVASSGAGNADQSKVAPIHSSSE